MADNFTNMGTETTDKTNSGIQKDAKDASEDAKKFIKSWKKSFNNGLKGADKSAEQYEGSGKNKNKELNGKNNNQSSTTSKKNRNKSNKSSSKKKSKKNKSKNSDGSIVGTGVYFYGHMSANIIRQILDMFVLQVKPLGAMQAQTSSSGTVKKGTIENTGTGSLINLMYNYMGEDGKKRTIKDILTTNIPESELQAQRVLDEMNGKTRWRIFNPDEAMEANPTQFMAYNGSVGQMLRDLSDAPFNELFWTHEADGKAKLNYRQTPFEQEEWKKLLTVNIDNTDLISMDLTCSDDEQYSIFDLESDYLLDNISAMVYLLPITDDYNELVSRYGYKYMEVSSQYFFNDLIQSGLTQDEIKEAQQTQEEESTDVTAVEHYPSLSTINEYFHADSKSALKSENVAKRVYDLSPSYGGNELYGEIVTGLTNGDSGSQLKKVISDYQSAHPSMTGYLNTNAITELMTIYKENKSLSIENYVETMFSPQEDVYDTDINAGDYLGQLKYILSKGYQYIGASTNRMKEAAQDMVLLSRGYIGSLQAYKLIQSYVKNAGQIPNTDYQSIFKNTKHSALESGVNTAASTSNKKGGQDFYARYNKYQIKLFNWFADNSKFYSGTITVTGRLGVEYGKKLYFTDKRRGVNWEFYIESVEHDFNFQTGWTTTIGVTRGLPVSKPNDPKRWSMYWGHAKAFTGGFFGELSLENIIKQAKIREDNEEDSGGSSNESSSDTSSPASGGAWRRPINTTPDLSPDSTAFGATLGRSYPHDGNDYGGSGYAGHKIRASHGGTVIKVGAHAAPSSWSGWTGGIIATKSSDGYYVIYQEFGLRDGGGKAYVKVGDKVKTGAVIGKQGDSVDSDMNPGATTGVHVHVGVSKKGLFNHSGSTTKGWIDLEKLIKNSK